MKVKKKFVMAGAVVLVLSIALATAASLYVSKVIEAEEVRASILFAEGIIGTGVNGISLTGNENTKMNLGANGGQIIIETEGAGIKIGTNEIVFSTGQNQRVISKQGRLLVDTELRVGDLASVPSTEIEAGSAIIERNLIVGEGVLLIGLSGSEGANGDAYVCISGSGLLSKSSSPCV